MTGKHNIKYIAAGTLSMISAVFFAFGTGYAAEADFNMIKSNIVAAHGTAIASPGTASSSDADEKPGGGDTALPPSDRKPIVLQEIISEVYYTTVYPGMPFEEFPAPKESFFLPQDDPGNWDLLRVCPINWGEEAFGQGQKSGQSSFIMTGTPTPESLNDEDRLLWEQGLLYVGESSYPKLKVNVVAKQTLPFRVELSEVGDDEYWAWFYFPAPHGASSVRLEASVDKQHWYTQEEWVGEEYTVEELKICMMVRDEEDIPVMRPSNRVPYYFRVWVEGSVYEGETAIQVINESKPPKENDDIDGNRGGVGVAEEGVDRVGIVKAETSQDLMIPEASQVTGEPDNQPQSEAMEVPEAVEAAARENRKYESDTPQTLTVEQTLLPQETQETKREIREPVVSSSIEESVYDAEAELQNISAVKKAYIPGFIWAILGTGLILLCGAAVIRLRETKHRNT